MGLKRWISAAVQLVGVLSLIVILAACSSSTGSTSSASPSSSMSSTDASQGIPDSAQLSPSDIMFAQMMIPHHQQAVEMSVLAETRASSAEVKELAAQIKNEQAPEIELMTKWLTDSNSPLSMGHDMGMGGMLTEDQMQELKDSQGPVFDQIFLQGMIEHHQGAIQMAQMIINSSNPEVKTLGDAIISSQTKQIEYMEGLLAN